MSGGWRMDCNAQQNAPELGGSYARENEAGLLAKSFAALRSPPDTI
jgi:hypothetical protein